MLNPSSLANAAGAALGAALGTVGGDTSVAGGGFVQRAVAGAAAKKAKAAKALAPAPRTPSSLLLDPATIKSLSTALGTLLGGGSRTAVPGYATATSSSSTSSRSALSFLSDPKLSIEEKLMRLMAYLSDRWEKEMQSKMNEIGAGEGDTSGTGTTKAKTTTKKKSGIFGTIASAVTSVVGGDTLKAVSGFLKIPGVKSALGKIAGPVLAAGASALGFGAAAPLLLQYGSKVVDFVGGVAGAASSSSSTSSSTSGTMTDGKRQQLVMEVQRIYEKQKEMFSLVSNILRTGHDTRMTAINNIR